MAIIPYDQQMEIGRGYDPVKGVVHGQALKRCTLESTSSGQDVHFRMLLVTSVEQLCRELDVEASLSISGFGSSGSAEVTVARKAEISQSEVMLLVMVKVANPAQRMPEKVLTDDAQKVIQEVDGTSKFRQYYGTHYISGVIYGGLLLGTVRIACKDSSERDRLSGELNFSGYGADAHGEMKQKIEQSLINKSQACDRITRGGVDLTGTGTIDEMLVLASNWPKIVSANPVEVYALTDEYDRTLPATSPVAIDPFVKQAMALNTKYASDKWLEFSQRIKGLQYYTVATGLNELVELFESEPRKKLLSDIKEEIDKLQMSMDAILQFLNEQHSSLKPVNLPTFHVPTLEISSLLLEERAKKAREAERQAREAELQARKEELNTATFSNEELKAKLVAAQAALCNAQEDLHNMEAKMTNLKDLDERIKKLEEMTDQGKPKGVPLATRALSADAWTGASKVASATDLDSVTSDVGDLKSDLDALSKSVSTIAEGAAQHAETLKQQLIDGSITVAKSRMLQGRNPEHFMCFHTIDKDNFDHFEMVRFHAGSEDWFPLIRVNKAK